MAYAIIIEEYQRPSIYQGQVLPGMTLTAALERLAEWAAGFVERSEEREAELIAEQNRATLQQIEDMIGIPRGRGLGG